jgi:hypothetical protein
MYGCVKTALLWYDLLTGTLKGMGFELLPYEHLMDNSSLEGKQFNIAWYFHYVEIPL